MGDGTNGATGGSFTTTQTNPNGCNGSMPVLTNPQGLASALVTWVQNAKTQGVPIYAVSAENEPDSCGINSTTSYSAAQLAAWIDVLGPAMAAIDVKVMAPETQNACGFTGYFNAIKNDTAAWNAVSIFASHEYGCGTLPSQPSIAAAGKEYWETEVDTGTGQRRLDRRWYRQRAAHGARRFTTTSPRPTSTRGTSGGFTTPAATAAASTTRARTCGPNASGSWATTRASCGPATCGFPPRGTAPSGVLVSAYQNPADGTVVVVAINSNTAATPLSLYVSGVVPCSITPWVTSATDSLASKSRHHGQQRSLQRNA